MKKIKGWKIVLTGLIVLLPCSVSAARYFRCAEMQSPDYPAVQATNYMSKLLSEKSKGKYAIKVFTNSVLGSEKDSIAQVQMGSLEMVRFNTAVFHDSIPETVLLSFPYLFRDDEHYRKVLHSAVGEEILAALEKKGFIGLALLDGGARSMYAQKPIRSPADVQGMIIRVMPSSFWTDFVLSLGAIPVALPQAEVLPALRSGVVGAAENNYVVYDDSRHYQAASYYSETRHVRAPSALVFSKKIWETLGRDEQQNIRQAAKEAAVYYENLWDKEQARVHQSLERNGVKFITDVNYKQFQLATEPVRNKYANTPALKDLMRRIGDVK